MQPGDDISCATARSVQLGDKVVPSGCAAFSEQNSATGQHAVNNILAAGDFPRYTTTQAWLPRAAFSVYTPSPFPTPIAGINLKIIMQGADTPAPVSRVAQELADGLLAAERDKFRTRVAETLKSETGGAVTKDAVLDWYA